MSDETTTSTLSEDVIARLPKVVLHDHLDGGVRPATVLELARETDYDALPAAELFDTVAEFRRVPNLFEILSYSYWHANHGYEIPDAARERMEGYLADPAGRAHVEAIARTKLKASGADPESLGSMDEATRRRATRASRSAAGRSASASDPKNISSSP